MSFCYRSVKSAPVNAKAVMCVCAPALSHRRVLKKANAQKIAQANMNSGTPVRIGAALEHAQIVIVKPKL